MKKMSLNPWKPLRFAALSFALIAAGCEGERGPQGDPGQPGEQGPKGDPGTSTTVDPSLSTVDKAFAGIGSKAAIQALQNFELELSGQRYVPGEGFTPDAEPILAHTFDGSRVRYDVRGDRLSINHQRNVKIFGFNVPQDYTELINGNRGFLEGSESLFGAPGGNLLSDRTAAIRRQQRLLNPHLILQEVAATPSLASEGGAALLDGSLHHLLVVNDPVYPLTLYVNAQTGKISKLVTLENDHLHRDIPIEVHYAGWQPAAGGLLFPKNVFIAANGHLLHVETRKTVTVNGTLAEALFQFPAGASPVYVEADALRGLKNHQFHHAFASIGIPLDGLQTTVAETKLAEGVYLLGGGSHNSMAIEQANGIVIVEAPLNPERSVAVINWVKAFAEFENKPITHVLATHHHDDHSAGLRAFVAEGAKIVVHESTAPYYRTIFRNPSTIQKDPLAEKPTAATLLTVPDRGSLRIDDATNPVTAYSFETVHARDMLLFYVPGTGEGGKVAFSSDLFNPGQGGIGNGPKELYTAITQTYNLPVETIAGGHGFKAPLSDLAKLANP